VKTSDRNNKDKALIKLIEAKKEDYKPWGLRARNEEQLYALYLLLEPSIKIVTISGTTGSGKSILTLAAGMQMVDSGKFDKVVVIRPMVAIGEEVGFLPGSLEDKLEPWSKPIYDNLCFMLNDPDGTYLRHYFDHKKIEVIPFTYLRGRSINNAFIYIDEAQNVSLHAIKSAISRAGNKSKVVLAGDLDQIDNLYTDRYSCGLTHVAEAFKNESIAGAAILTKSERSKIAELAAQLL
jgi:PhoH-like ATPase